VFDGENFFELFRPLEYDPQAHVEFIVEKQGLMVVQRMVGSLTSF
jgi:hypothetical protein